MHKKLKTYTAKEIDQIIKRRKSGTKFGEKIQLLRSTGALERELNDSDSKYVLLGIPEDAGIIGNFGKPGARNAWKPALSALLNMQANSYYKASKLLLLGYLDFEKELKELDAINAEDKIYIEKARAITAEIDKEVTYYIRLIVASGKKPIVVGGGHNNCYGILKGCALALNQAINTLNIDAHTDLRPIEGRHSGNGFTYALRDGFLHHYFIFGLHENYLSKEMLKKIAGGTYPIKYNTYEELEIKNSKGIEFQLNAAKEFLSIKAFGLEVDCDSIIDIPSSAMTPSGFEVKQVRKFVYHLSQHKNAQYLHICEAAPSAADDRELEQTGKLIAYLITDFMRK
ncbi:formimidoylglutamase [Flavobacteriaceae bacterium M23B6Z8]